MKKTVKIILILAGILAVIFLAIAAFAYATTFSDWWTKFPEPLRTDTAMARLEAAASGVGCRESCMFEKDFYRRLIANQLVAKGYGGHTGKLVASQITQEDKDVSYRESLVTAIYYAEKAKKEKDPAYAIKMPGFLLEYLGKTGANAEVRADILAVFPEDAGASEALLSNLLELIKDKSKSVGERVLAMRDLRNIIAEDNGDKENPSPKFTGIDYPAVCGILLNIAENERNDSRDNIALRGEAIDNMAGCVWVKGVFTEEFFSRLKNIFYKGDTQIGIQNEIINLMSGYQNVSKNEMIKFFQKVNSDERVSKYVRLTVASYLAGFNVAYKNIEMTKEEHDSEYIIVQQANY